MKGKKHSLKGPDKVKEELEAEKKKVGEYTELLQKVQADFENFRKRSEKEREQDRRYANQQIVQEFLDVKDNLERALENAGEHESVVKGVELTLKQLGALLNKHGVEEMNPAGEKFDPNLHEALMADEADVEDETVSEVLQKGYMLHERVVRPAKVKITKPREVS